MNTELRAKTKNNFEIKSFRDMTNFVCGKTKGIVRKNRDIKLMTTDRKRLLSAGKSIYFGAQKLVLIVVWLSEVPRNFMPLVRLQGTRICLI